MEIGYIGLGKMGLNMAIRLQKDGHNIHAWNRSPEPRNEAGKEGIKTYESVKDLVNSFSGQKIIWLMLPHDVVDEMIFEIKSLLSKGDIVIDGGNSFYKDSIRRGQELEKVGIHFLDAGVSGGPAGARDGACIMVGGPNEIFEIIEPVIKSAAASDCYSHVSQKVGGGHFVKMIHNGIEYGMMQAIGEGFNILKNSDFGLNLSEVARIYNCRSVIESRLVGWLKEGFDKYGENLEDISGEISHTGEGKWTVEAGKEMGIETPVIESAFDFRVNSKDNPSFTGKIVSVLRNMFGGHDVKK